MTRPQTASHLVVIRTHAPTALSGSSARWRLITPLAYWSLGVFVVVDLIWLTVSTLKVATSNLWMVGQTCLVMGLWFCTFRLISSRLRDDRSRIASTLRAAADGGDLLLRVAVFSVCWGIAIGTYMYLATSAALPLQDARLASLDQILGFDWLDFLALANSSRVVSWALVGAYHSVVPQILLLYVLLSFGRHEQRLAEFLTLYSVTCVAVGVLMVLVPAAGAYAHYNPQPELFDGFSSNAGMFHYEHFTLLRTQAAPLLDFRHVEGLVTFPSFHTVLAIIIAYAVRGVRFIALPTMILNAIVIVSTLPEGGHFLVDVIAGAIIAVVGIALVRWEQSGWTTTHLRSLRAQ